MTPEEICRLKRLLCGVQLDQPGKDLDFVNLEQAGELRDLLTVNVGAIVHLLRDYIRAKAYLRFLEDNPRGCERRWMKYDELAAGYEERVWEELAAALADKTENVAEAGE